jgi:hypothetical protein
MSDASFYKWRAKYGGMDASMVSQMKAIEDENRRLKKMFAELSLQNELLKEALGKNSSAISTPRDGRDCGGEARGQHCAGLPDVWRERDVLSLFYRELELNLRIKPRKRLCRKRQTFHGRWISWRTGWRMAGRSGC